MSRKAILKALTESDVGVLGENVILRQTADDAMDARTTLAALDGLVDEGILERYALMDSRFYTIADGVSRRDISQAEQNISAGEVAEDYIQSSTFIYSPQEVRDRPKDIDKLIDKLFKITKEKW